MKFDDQMTRVLKNFSTINKSILFKPGKVLSTVAPTKTVLAKAKIDQELTDEFAIYEVPQLLGVLSLFNDPDVEVGTNALTIKQGKETVRYKFASLETIVYPTKDLTMPSTDVEFDLTQENLSKLLKAASVLSLPEMLIKGEDGVLTMGASDSSDQTKDAFTVELGATDKTFKVFVKIENLKMIPGNYHVVISASQAIKVIQFTNEVFSYWVAVEAKQSTWS